MLRPSRLLCGLGLTLALCLSGGPPAALAQKKPGAEDTAGRLPQDPNEITKLRKYYTDRVNDFRAFSTGDKTPGKSDADMIDQFAKWYTYRLTWREETNKPGGASGLLTQVENVLRDATRGRPKSDPFLQQFGKAMTTRVKEILTHDDLTVRVNAMLLLPIVARTGYEDLADLLVEILKDDRQSDAVRYWAVPALKELFAMGRGPNPITFKNKEREENAIRALLNYLNRKVEFPKNLTEEELKQHEAGVQYTRRAAIRALGETRYPALMKRENNINVPDEKGLTALALLRVLANDGMEPKASVSEQVEAAIALCQLQLRLSSELNVDYAAHYLGLFLVEFANRYQNERNDKQEPWRQHAGRLMMALADWSEDIRKNRALADPGAKYVQELIIKGSTGFLKAIEAGSAESNPANLADALRTEPPSKSLFRGLDKAVITRKKESG